MSVSPSIALAQPLSGPAVLFPPDSSSQAIAAVLITVRNRGVQSTCELLARATAGSVLATEHFLHLKRRLTAPNLPRVCGRERMIHCSMSHKRVTISETLPSLREGACDLTNLILSHRLGRKMWQWGRWRTTQLSTGLSNKLRHHNRDRISSFTFSTCCRIGFLLPEKVHKGM